MLIVFTQYLQIYSSRFSITLIKTQEIWLSLNKFIIYSQLRHPKTIALRSHIPTELLQKETKLLSTSLLQSFTHRNFIWILQMVCLFTLIFSSDSNWYLLNLLFIKIYCGQLAWRGWDITSISLLKTSKLKQENKRLFT